MSKTLLCIDVSFQRCKLCCHWTEYKAASSDACLLLFFFSRGAKGDSGPISLFFCHTLSIPSQRTVHTHIPHASSIYRHTEPAEGRHHISTEVVNRPSEAFLEGVSSSAFIEPLSDY